METKIPIDVIRQRYIYLGTSALDSDEMNKCIACGRIVSPGDDHVYHCKAMYTVPLNRIWIGICGSCHATIETDGAS